MKGDPKVIELLNDILTDELTAVNQYWIHARMCENWGYLKLWNKLRAEAIDEMKHADELVARILLLDGMPNLQRIGKVNVGQTVPEQFELDLVVEQTAVPKLNKAVALCRELGDNGTFELLQRILVDEELHLDWLETQLDLINSVGLGNYLAQQM